MNVQNKVKHRIKGLGFNICGGPANYWTKNYYKDNSFTEKIWHIYQVMNIIVFVRIISIIKILSLEKDGINYKRLHIYLGAFANYLGGPPIYTELLLMLWTLSNISLNRYCICGQRKEFSWLKVFVFLNQSNIKGIKNNNLLHIRKIIL